MSGIELIIASIGFASSLLPFISGFTIKKVLKKRKYKKKIINLCLDDYFKFVNDNIIYNPSLFTENNYELTFLSVKYSLINKKIYGLFDISNINFKKNFSFYEILNDIVNYNLEYTNFITYLRENKHLSNKYEKYFLNINNFEKIKNSVISYENKISMREFINSFKNVEINTYKNYYFFLSTFLLLYKTLSMAIIEDLKKDILIKKINNYPLKNILFEISSEGNILNYNTMFSHLFDYLNENIINNNIKNNSLFSNNKDILKFVKNNKNINLKIKKNSNDNFYSINIYTKIINLKKYILINEEGLKTILSLSPELRKDSIYNLSP